MADNADTPRVPSLLSAAFRTPTNIQRNCSQNSAYGRGFAGRGVPAGGDSLLSSAGSVPGLLATPSRFPDRPGPLFKPSYDNSVHTPRKPLLQDHERPDCKRFRSDTGAVWTPESNRIHPLLPLPEREAPYRESYMPESRGVVERCNDCEIIVADKSITLYAEHVERRLKSAGLRVDLLFPRTLSSIAQIINDIDARGVLYAVAVNLNDERYRTLSVNVLHTRPAQEHCNVPLDEAIAMIERNFQTLCERAPASLPQPVAANTLSVQSRPIAAANHSSQLLLAPPPPAIVTLMEFVRLNRLLSVAEYDQLINYLEDRREQQLQPSNGSHQQRLAGSEVVREADKTLCGRQTNDCRTASDQSGSVVAASGQTRAEGKQSREQSSEFTAASAPKPLLTDTGRDFSQRPVGRDYLLETGRTRPPLLPTATSTRPHISAAKPLLSSPYTRLH